MYWGTAIYGALLQLDVPNEVALPRPHAIPCNHDHCNANDAERCDNWRRESFGRREGLREC